MSSQEANTYALQVAQHTNLITNMAAMFAIADAYDAGKKSESDKLAQLSDWAHAVIDKPENDKPAHDYTHSDWVDLGYWLATQWVVDHILNKED